MEKTLYSYLSMDRVTMINSTVTISLTVTCWVTSGHSNPFIFVGKHKPRWHQLL